MLKHISKWFKTKGQEFQDRALLDRSLLNKRQELDGSVGPKAEATQTEPDRQGNRQRIVASIAQPLTGWQRRLGQVIVYGILALVLAIIIQRNV